MTPLIARYRALPRAGRWLALAAGVTAAYFVIVEPVLDATASLRARADRIEADLRRERAVHEDLAAPGRTFGAARAAFGTPLLPGGLVQRKQALQDRVNQILKAHNVRTDIVERTMPLRDDRVAPLLDGAERLDRLILDVTFEATPDTVLAVLADLEQAEEVSAVSRVQIRKLDPGRAGSGGGGGGGGTGLVRVLISPEAWVQVINSDAGLAGGGRL